MSKHWKPDDEATPLDLPWAGERLRPDYAPPSKRQALPPGALAGLILVAVACAGVMLALNQAFGREDVFAEELPPPR